MLDIFLSTRRIHLKGLERNNVLYFQLSFALLLKKNLQNMRKSQNHIVAPSITSIIVIGQRVNIRI